MLGWDIGDIDVVGEDSLHSSQVPNAVNGVQVYVVDTIQGSTVRDDGEVDARCKEVLEVL